MLRLEAASRAGSAERRARGVLKAPPQGLAELGSGTQAGGLHVAGHLLTERIRGVPGAGGEVSGRPDPPGGPARLGILAEIELPLHPVIGQYTGELIAEPRALDRQAAPKPNLVAVHGSL